MPWDLTIQREDGQALEERESVVNAIRVALPQIEFGREPSGLERIELARAQGIEFPDVLRKHFESQPGKVTGEGILDGCSVRFYGFESAPLLAFEIEVRGSGDPTASLLSLCRQQGWIAIDCATQRPLG